MVPVTAVQPETITGGEPLAVSLGITYRQLDYWVLQGHLRPLDPQPGTGTARKRRI